MHIKKIILCMSGTIFSFNTYANTYENQLEQITITASKNNESFVNSTHAVAVTNDTKITKQQPTNIYQVLNTMSGVHVDATNPFFAIPQIRGLSRGHTIINVDGFSKSYNSNKGNALSPISIDPYLIKQIDLTKGSSSGVYGSGGLGGVISISTKNATDLLNPNSNIGGFIRSQYYSIDNTHRESIGFYGQNNNKKSNNLKTIAPQPTTIKADTKATDFIIKLRKLI